VNKQIRIWRDEVSNGKTIIISQKMKDIPPIYDRIVRNLVPIEVIKFIKVRPDLIAASNEIFGAWRDPVATPHHPMAIGVSLVFSFQLQTMQFYEITSARKGYGQKMVAAVLEGLPEDWEVCIVMDWSGGFWGKMKAQHFSVAHTHVLFYSKSENPVFNTYCRFGPQELQEKNISLLKADQKDVWHITRNNRPKRMKNPTHLPAELVRKIIRYSSQPEDYVLDMFAGEFTTAREAIKLGRKAITMEANPHAWSAAVRIEKFKEECLFRSSCRCESNCPVPENRIPPPQQKLTVDCGGMPGLTLDAAGDSLPQSFNKGRDFLRGHEAVHPDAAIRRITIHDSIRQHNPI
jgi:DNA methylase